MLCESQPQIKPKEISIQSLASDLDGTSYSPYLGCVQAIIDMNPPQDIKGVQCFLGMCNYLSCFTPNLAEIVKPLTELTHVGAIWSWSSQHNKACKDAKAVIAKATSFKFFDVNKPCVLQVVASDTGLGGALLHEGQSVAFTSSTLLTTEINYALLKRSIWPLIK